MVAGGGERFPGACGNPRPSSALASRLAWILTSQTYKTFPFTLCCWRRGAKHYRGRQLCAQRVLTRKPWERPG